MTDAGIGHTGDSRHPEAFVIPVKTGIHAAWTPAVAGETAPA